MEAALAEYQKVIADNPNHAEAHYALGNILFEQGRTDDALKQYQEALRNRPDYPEVETTSRWLTRSLIGEKASRFDPILRNRSIIWPGCSRLFPMTRFETERRPSGCRSAPNKSLAAKSRRSCARWPRPMRRPDDLAKRSTLHNADRVYRERMTIPRWQMLSSVT